MAPNNIAGQPITLVNELKRRGIDISLVQYTGKLKGHKFGYDVDKIVQYEYKNRDEIQIATIESLLADGVGIFHFWLRSLFFSVGSYYDFTGFDIPIIRSYGRKIVYRFTGEDLRIKSVHINKNPYNAYQYGYETIVDEYRQRKYLDFLSENVDQFIVQDIELQEFCPEAKVVPRSLDISRYPYIGQKNKDRPLVVHAPSNPEVKGTQFVRAAIDQLRQEGLPFDYREISNLQHDEAIALYKRSDIVIDQLFIGWYGVLSIEAMALGKVVITYVREDLYEKHVPRIPIMNANPDTIVEVLRSALTDYDSRVEIGLQARTFAEKNHSVENVGNSLLQIYRNLSIPQISPNNKFATLDYFALQIESLKEYRDISIGYNKLKKIGGEKLVSKLKNYDVLVKEIRSLRVKAKQYSKLVATGREKIISQVARNNPSEKNRDVLPEKLKRFFLYGKSNVKRIITKLRNRIVWLLGIRSYRIKAKQYDALVEKAGNNLVSKIRHYDDLSEEVLSLRPKGRRYDALVNIGGDRLVSKLKNFDSLSEEVRSLRGKAKKYDILSDQVQSLRVKAKKYDTLENMGGKNFISKIKNYDTLYAELKPLKWKAKQYDELYEDAGDSLHYRVKNFENIREQYGDLYSKLFDIEQQSSESNQKNRSNLKFTVVLLIGGPRTGTTLLNSFLAWAPQTHQLNREAGPLLNFMEHRRQMVNAMNRFSGIKDDNIANLITRYAVKTFIDQHFESEQVPVLIFRSPALSRHITELWHLLDWANVKVIICTRDPRDVVVSLLEWNSKRIQRDESPLFDEPSVENAANFFNSYYNRVFHSDTPFSGNDLHYIRYEDMVVNPLVVVKQMEVFLGLDLSDFQPNEKWKPGRVDYDKEQKSNAAVTDLYGQIPTDKHVGRFKSILSEDQIVRVEQICQRIMNKFSYEHYTN